MLKMRFLPVLSLLIILTANTGCKKEDTQPPPDPNAIGLSVRINDTWRTFYVAARAVMTNNGGNYSYFFEGYDASQNGDLLQIAFDTTVPLTAGTYSNNQPAGFLVRVFYGSQYYFGYSSWKVTNSGFGGSDENITINEIDANAVKGSFRCTLFPTNFFDLSNPKTLTSGHFNLKF